MITRTALAALKRINGGLPAFKTPAPKHLPLVAKSRREAIVDLVALRYIKRTKRGPVITSTGKRALQTIEEGARKYGEIPIAAKRFGVKLTTVNSRYQDLREPLRYE